MSALATTSLVAYKLLNLTELESDVAIIIESFGVNGCTAHEILTAFPRFTHETLTPRFAPLVRKGATFRAGDTRIGGKSRQQDVLRDIKYAGFVPTVVTKPKKNPFLAGLIYAAKLIVAADPSFKRTPAALALLFEIKKVARR